MNRQQFKAVLLAAGFKEKLQPDGTMDLNPYCYAAGAAPLQAGRDEVATALLEHFTTDPHVVIHVPLSTPPRQRAALEVQAVIAQMKDNLG
jgi:hypothetical protein